MNRKATDYLIRAFIDDRAFETNEFIFYYEPTKRYGETYFQIYIYDLEKGLDKKVTHLPIHDEKSAAMQCMSMAGQYTNDASTMDKIRRILGIDNF